MVAVATSHEESKKRSRSVILNKYLSFGSKIAKIGPVDPEIIVSPFKKEINASKIYAYSQVGNGKFAEWAKKNLSQFI